MAEREHGIGYVDPDAEKLARQLSAFYNRPDANKSMIPQVKFGSTSVPGRHVGYAMSGSGQTMFLPYYWESFLRKPALALTNWISPPKTHDHARRRENEFITKFDYLLP